MTPRGREHDVRSASTTMPAHADPARLRARRCALASALPGRQAEARPGQAAAPLHERNAKQALRLYPGSPSHAKPPTSPPPLSPQEGNHDSSLETRKHAKQQLTGNLEPSRFPFFFPLFFRGRLSRSRAPLPRALPSKGSRERGPLDAALDPGDPGKEETKATPAVPKSNGLAKPYVPTRPSLDAERAHTRLLIEPYLIFAILVPPPPLPS